jgi:uncharacterized cupredoxin-like copper-binding protein
MKRISGLALIGLIVVATNGCSAYWQDSAATSSPSIILEDYRFTPNRIDAKVGVPLTVRLTNKGTERHDLNFESFHMPGLGGVESIVEPGESRTITLTFDQPGSHTFICTLAGHAAAGMTGAVFVTP